MKTLFLMRHAKSDWNAEYGSDHDRPLNERGLWSARAIGEALAADDAVPELVITSTAVRARSTAQLAADAGGWTSEIVLDPRLYGSGADTVVSVAAETPTGVDRLMLVGHQPTWSMVVSALTGEQVEMKTAMVAVIGLDIDDWANIGSAPGRVEQVYHPRDHLD